MPERPAPPATPPSTAPTTTRKPIRRASDTGRLAGPCNRTQPGPGCAEVRATPVTTGHRLLRSPPPLLRFGPLAGTCRWSDECQHGSAGERLAGACGHCDVGRVGQRQVACTPPLVRRLPAPRSGGSPDHGPPAGTRVWGARPDDGSRGTVMFSRCGSKRAERSSPWRGPSQIPQIPAGPPRRTAHPCPPVPPARRGPRPARRTCAAMHPYSPQSARASYVHTGASR